MDANSTMSLWDAIKVLAKTADNLATIVLFLFFVYIVIQFIVEYFQDKKKCN